MTDPHPKLVPLLERHAITWEAFSKKGRPKTGDDSRSKRAAIVTELHAQGTPWAEMLKITGLSNGSIQRLTGAMWNHASRENSRERGRRVGSSWKGKKRPGAIEALWASGVFDFHRGRVRPEAERRKLRDSWTEDRRKEVRRRLCALWKNPSYRSQLLSYHQSNSERARRSEEQSLRLKSHPNRYTRGCAQWIDVTKTTVPRLRVRSSWEAKAVRKLESDPEVLRYEYEVRIRLDDGRWILPDFIVERRNGTTSLVEVKAEWVLSFYPPDHAVHRRLEKSREVASNRGWIFEVWTEKEW